MNARTPLRLDEKPVHVRTCRHRVPIVTPYTVINGTRGSDRIVKSWPKALELALRRAPERGRQTVRQHNGWLLHKVWVVQDA